MTKQEWYYANRQSQSEYNKLYYQANREAISERRKQKRQNWITR